MTINTMSLRARVGPLAVGAILATVPARAQTSSSPAAKTDTPANTPQPGAPATR